MMQKAFQRFTSLLLSLTMLLSLASTAFAADEETSTSAFTNTGIEEFVSVDLSLSEEESARALFENLSEEARQIFLSQIAADPELTEYHRENVDPSFDSQAIPVTYAANNAVDSVRSGLINAGFSSSVVYCFSAAASEIYSLSASASASQIYDALLGTGLAAILASMAASIWDEIEAGFSRIVAIFEDGFSDNRSAVSDALWDTKDDATSVYYSSRVVSCRYTTYVPDVSDATVSLDFADGTHANYICDVRAEDATIKSGKYYVALLVRDSNGKTQLMVCPNSVNFAVALAIRYLNKEYVGIMTKEGRRASALARNAAPNQQVTAVYHSNERHKDNPNFFPHYHPQAPDGTTSGQVHIWFVR